MDDLLQRQGSSLTLAPRLVPDKLVCGRSELPESTQVRRVERLPFQIGQPLAEKFRDNSSSSAHICDLVLVHYADMSKFMARTLFAAAAVAAGLTGCSSEEKPAPPPMLVVDATIGGQQMTITGQSRCWSADNGNFLIQATDKSYGATGDTSLDASVEKDSTAVRRLELQQGKTEFFIALDVPKGDLTATRDGNTIRITGGTVSRTDNQNKQVDVTINCSEI